MAQTGIIAQDIRAMLRSEARPGLQLRNEQVVFLHNFAETECGKSLSNQVLGYYSKSKSRTCGKSAVRRKQKRAPRRPLALNSEEEKVVIEFIEAVHSKEDFVTQRSMSNLLEANFGKCLTHGWVATFLVRHTDRVCRAVVSPQEKPRLEIPQTFLNHYLALIQEYVPLVPTELMSNIDESGFSD
jgi:hypothetical protein